MADILPFQLNDPTLLHQILSFMDIGWLRPLAKPGRIAQTTGPKTWMMLSSLPIRAFLNTVPYRLEKEPRSFFHNIAKSHLPATASLNFLLLI
ncbi:unnamed protein product [Clonostachys rhizophaga]|uniref:Uncharacterized protein n=1 Tax=Clonostachys rhizophaga TaxID=160324 RepID=A0A9N9VEJ1_9HYPO|nr:unnamed protein product [Clonostachys rhizophaga]